MKTAYRFFIGTSDKKHVIQKGWHYQAKDTTLNGVWRKAIQHIDKFDKDVHSGIALIPGIRKQLRVKHLEINKPFVVGYVFGYGDRLAVYIQKIEI